MKQFYPLVLIALIFGLVSMKPRTLNTQPVAVYKTSQIYDETIVAPEISISPNPVEKELFLYSSTPLNIESLGIHNISGKLIQNCPSNDLKIDVHNLPTGIYYLKITTQQDIITSRFIKK